MAIRNYERAAPRAFQRGYTLMEGVIVLVITTVLMAVALPSYQNSIIKSNRSDAKGALMAVAGRMEQRMLDHGSYSYDMQDLGYTSDPMVTEEGLYTVDAAACPDGSAATCYVLTALPVASLQQAKDKWCTSFILDYTGAKTATGQTPNECWN